MTTAVRALGEGLGPISFVAVAAWLVVVTADAATAQATAIGAEFQVNTYTLERQEQPAVAVDADGGFVVVWSSGGVNGQDGAGYGIFGRRFNSSGAPLAVEFQVNSYTSVFQQFPSIAMAADGRFVVAWDSLRDGGGDGIFARHFDAAGTPLAAEFQVNVYTYADQENSSIAMDDDGNFIVVWDSERQEDPVSGLGVFGRRFDTAGNPLAVEFQVNTFTPGNQYEPRAAADDDGDFVVVWWSFGQDGNQRGVFGRRFDSSGTPLASEFLANTYTSGFQDEAAVAMDADGDFVVVFEGGTNSDGSGEGTFARRFDSAGAAQGSQFQVNLVTAGGQGFPRVGMDGDGDFVVIWLGSPGIVGRRFDSAGAPQTGDFQINTYTQASLARPDVGMNADGDFTVAWQEFGHDGNSYGVFGRRHVVLTLVPADIDGNTAIAPLVDGLLILRHLFGFDGAALISAAVGPNCSRCDAPTIKVYLNGLGLTLDVDGNGTPAPLTDGLLMLRYMFGFTGTALTTGATAVDCSRCDAAMIIPYLETLL